MIGAVQIPVLPGLLTALRSAPKSSCVCPVDSSFVLCADSENILVFHGELEEHLVLFAMLKTTEAPSAQRGRKNQKVRIMHNEKQVEQIMRTNQEILEKLCAEMRLIAAYGNLPLALKKRLYSAEYWAKYFMEINNALLKEHCKEQDNQLQTPTTRGDTF